MEDALQQQSVLGETTRVATNDISSDAGFVALVERQSAFLFRIAYSVVRNTHDAEDAVQEMFFKLYRTNAWREIRDERSFLARMAWRVAVSRLKRVRDEQPDPATPSSEPSPESAAIDADWNGIVRRLMDALPEDLRQPLALSALNELESADIAAILGIPEGTVRSRILRARTLLKQKLARYREVPHAR